MTGPQMLISFKFFLDKLDTASLPDFAPEEIYLLLNEAQERDIKTTYSGNNPLRLGFEQIQKRTEDLNPLKVTRFCTAQTLSAEPGVYVINTSTLYTDEACTTNSELTYQFFLRCQAKVTKTGTSSAYVPVNLAQTDDLDKLKSDPFNQPTFPYPVLYFEEGKIYLLTDSTYSVDKARITCIRRAKAISPTQACELPEHKHPELVQKAVQIALESVESPRQQTQAPTIATQE